MSARIRRLVERARASGLEPAEDAAERLDRFAALVVERGERLALVSKADLSLRALADRHFADARTALLFAGPPRGARILDFGAGAGVIGVTWALLRPDLTVTFLESRHRKAVFLRRAVEALSLEGASVIEGRAEEETVEEGYDMVVSRGVATDWKTLRTIAGLLGPEGAMVFFKGPESAGPTRALLAGDDRFELVAEKEIALGDERRRIYIKGAQKKRTGGR